MALTEKRKKLLLSKYSKEKVQSLAKKRRGAITAPVSLQQQTVGEPGIAGFQVGAAKAALGDVRESAGLLSRIQARIPEGVKSKFRFATSAMPGAPVAREVIKRTPGLVERGFEKAEERAGLAEGELTTPIGKAEKAGAVTFNVGTFVVPFGAFGISKARKIPRLLRGTKFKPTGTVEEMIAPGINTKETRRIVAEGRATRTTESRLFGKRPTIVEQTDQIRKAAKTIEKRIPLKRRKDDLELVKSINSEVESISKKLAPELKKARVTPKLRNKTTGAWESLKKAQADDAEFLNFPGAPRLQLQFERYLNDLRKKPHLTMDDIWKTRKDYDKFIKPQVKEAGPGSTPFNLYAKERWLENRQILNDLLTEGSDVLSVSTKRTFGEMTHLYSAKQNLVSKTKLDLKGKPGILEPSNLEKQFLRFGLGFLGFKVLSD